MSPKRQRSDYSTDLLVDKLTYITVYRKLRKILLTKYRVLILPIYKQTKGIQEHAFYNIKLRTYYSVGGRFNAAKKLLEKYIKNLKVNRIEDLHIHFNMENLSAISDSEIEDKKHLSNSSQDTIILLNDTEDNNDNTLEVIDLINEDTEVGTPVINLLDDNETQAFAEQNKSGSAVLPNKENVTESDINFMSLSQNPIIIADDSTQDVDVVGFPHFSPKLKRKLPDFIDLCDSQDELSENRAKKLKLSNVVNCDIINLVDTPPNYNNNRVKRKKRSKSKQKRSLIGINSLSVVTSTPIAKTRETSKKIETVTTAPNFDVAQQYIPFTTSKAVTQPNAVVNPPIITPVETHTSSVGYNIYNPNINKNPIGLRPIIIDGSNVAVQHGIATGSKEFSVAGIEICMEYFVKRGHLVKTFIPHFRLLSNNSTNHRRLQQLEDQGKIICTPSRKIGGRTIASYDDRYIVQAAAEFGGVIVSNDNYRDLIQENHVWRDTIERRLLMFTWVGDCLMFPLDPLGRNGPTLDQFLRF